MKTYPQWSLQKSNKMNESDSKQEVPSFKQFIQFIISSHEKGISLDEHWQTMNKFCSPCLVDFDVYAKVGGYFLFE